MADSRSEAEYAQAEDRSYYTERKLSKTTVSKRHTGQLEGALTGQRWDNLHFHNDKTAIH